MVCNSFISSTPCNLKPPTKLSSSSLVFVSALAFLSSLDIVDTHKRDTPHNLHRVDFVMKENSSKEGNDGQLHSIYHNREQRRHLKNQTKKSNAWYLPCHSGPKPNHHIWYLSIFIFPYLPIQTSPFSTYDATTRSNEGRVKLHVQDNWKGFSLITFSKLKQPTQERKKYKISMYIIFIQ